MYDVYALSLVVPVLYLLVGYFGIKVTSASAITVGVIQLAVFTVLALFMIVKAPYNSLAYFNVNNSLDGFHGFFLGMVTGAFLAYGGYGSVVSLGEEAKLPKNTLKKAVVTALAIMVAFETLVVYSIVAAAGPNLSNVDQQFAPGLYLVDQMFGVYIALVAFSLVVIAQVFSPVIFGNSGARTLYALTRDGLLPSSFAEVHPKYRSPHRATILVFILVVVGVLSTEVPLVASQGESDGLFYSFALWGTAITIFTLLYHIFTNASLPLFLRRLGAKQNFLITVVGPSIASIITAIAIYYSLLGLTFPISLVYILIPVWIILGLLVILLRRHKTRVEELGELTGVSSG